MGERGSSQIHINDQGGRMTTKYLYVDRNILSLLFHNFNKLKALTRVQPVLIDWVLLRRAFGEVQRKVIDDNPVTYNYRMLLTDPQLDVEHVTIKLMEAYK
jgi:hypothetical protein